MAPSPKLTMYSGTKLVDALAAQHEKRSNSGLFKSGEFILDWRSKVGSFPHPDNETLISAGEPCGDWNIHNWNKPHDLNQLRVEGKGKSLTLTDNLKSFKELPLNGYVPAASIRGIVRAWVSEYLDLVPEMRRLLGWQNGSEITAGKIEFLDAFPIEATKLTLDIVNPQQDFQVFHTGSASPLSLYTLGDSRKKVEIKVAIRGCRGADTKDVATVWEWVQQALSTHGVGSRTASGYGALIAPTGYNPSPELAKLPAGYSSKKLNFALYSQGSAGPNTTIPELRPTHWRGWLRSWLMRFFLGVMEKVDAIDTVDELLGSLNRQGLVRLQTKIDRLELSQNTTKYNKFCKWTGSFEISAPTDILDELILPVIKIAVRVGGMGRGWRRPLHRFILKTTYGNNESARGCHLELTRSPTDVITNSTHSKLDLAGNDLNLIYDVWKDAVIKNLHDRYQENILILDAEVFSPASCAVYLVPGTAQNPIDPSPDNLKWLPGETTDTRGKGMALIYQLKYKRKEDVGGDRSKCSWVSIKRINGSKSNPQCQEIVCIFMGGENKRRKEFLADLANIPGAIHLFGRQPT
jgi:CRISPR-associated protein Cmr6